MENYSEEKKYKRAKERVEEIKGAYYHLFSYIGVLTFLAILNYTIDKWENPWFLWVAFGWGIGLIIHLLVVINWSPFLGKNWEERKIQQFMKEDYESERKFK
ncbi:histidine kinase [Flavobacteriaceae bacterium R38]|nr:histidine kinase [Flavobacteriaceae bacterium R38]